MPTFCSAVCASALRGECTLTEPASSGQHRSSATSAEHSTHFGQHVWKHCQVRLHNTKRALQNGNHRRRQPRKSSSGSGIYHCFRSLLCRLCPSEAIRVVVCPRASKECFGKSSFAQSYGHKALNGPTARLRAENHCCFLRGG